MSKHIAIIGAGVAGLTAAIAARQAGLEATVFERHTHLKRQPGETLHPGLEPLFEKLGVVNEVVTNSAVRHRGIITLSDGTRTRTPYGETDGVPWKGFQIERRSLKNILLNRATQLGANIVFECGRLTHETSGQAALAIYENGRRFVTDWLIDATGPSSWSSRIDRLRYRRATPLIVVCYGYSHLKNDRIDIEWPVLEVQDDGWNWKARIEADRLAWVASCRSRPNFEKLRAKSSGTADGTWQVSECPARSKVFRVGDAAFRMDPSTGKGVMRGMMSSIMAVHLIAAQYNNVKGAQMAEQVYNNWLENWFWNDFEEMKLSGKITRLNS